MNDQASKNQTIETFLKAIERVKGSHYYQMLLAGKKEISTGATQDIREAMVNRYSLERDEWEKPQCAPPGVRDRWGRVGGK